MKAKKIVLHALTLFLLFHAVLLAPPKKQEPTSEEIRAKMLEAALKRAQKPVAKKATRLSVWNKNSAALVNMGIDDKVIVGGLDGNVTFSPVLSAVDLDDEISEVHTGTSQSMPQSSRMAILEKEIAEMRSARASDKKAGMSEDNLSEIYDVSLALKMSEIDALRMDQSVAAEQENAAQGGVVDLSQLRPNRGNYNDDLSCFINSVIQMLYHSPQFMNFVISVPVGASPSLDLLRNHLMVMAAVPAVTHVSGFRRQICPLVQMPGHNMAVGQHDASEFLERLFVKIAEELQGDHRQRFNDLIGTLIAHIWQHTLGDGTIHRLVEDRRSDNEYRLRLPIVGNSLGTCLDAYFAPVQDGRTTQDVCPRCIAERQQQIQYDTECTQITKVPQVFMIELERFDRTPGRPAKKIDMIMIPQVMPLADARFQLMSFVVHCGSLAAGHYWTYARCGGTWYCYNDCADNKARRVNDVEIAFMLGEKIEQADQRAFIVDLLQTVPQILYAPTNTGGDVFKCAAPYLLCYEKVNEAGAAASA